MITIQPYTQDDWRYGGTTATLRVFATADFKTGSDVVKKGNADADWHQDYVCTVVGDDITIPAITLPSTTNSNNPNKARYSFVFIDSNGINRGYFQRRFYIPHLSGSPISWELLINVNAIPFVAALPGAVNLQQVQTLIADALVGATSFPSGGNANQYVKGNAALADFNPAVDAAVTISREYLVCKPDSGTDITAKLAAQILSINESNAKGGVIVIPRGAWTFDGGVNVPSTTKIDGMGKDARTGFGTRLWMNGLLSTTGAINPNVAAFNIGAFGGVAADRRDIRISNMEINMTDQLSKNGVFMTNPDGQVISEVHLEGLLFKYGNAGGQGMAIKVFATGGGFECILNTIKRCDFIGPLSAFFCNTLNGSFLFESIYSSQAPGSLMLDLISVGNLEVNDWLAVGNSAAAVGGFQSDGSTFMKTTGAYNNIHIKNLQTELVEFAYKNGTNHFPQKAIKWSNGLIQSKMQYTAQASVIDDNNTWVNNTGSPTFRDAGTALAGAGALAAWVHLYRIGQSDVETRSATAPVQPTYNNVLTGFTNPYSRIIDRFGQINKPVNWATGTTGRRTVHATRGSVNIPVGAGITSIIVDNNLVGVNSIVKAQLLGHESGVWVTAVVCGDEFFTIYLNAVVTAERRIGFEVVFPVERVGTEALS